MELNLNLIIYNKFNLSINLYNSLNIIVIENRVIDTHPIFDLYIQLQALILTKLYLDTNFV